MKHERGGGEGSFIFRLSNFFPRNPSNVKGEKKWIDRHMQRTSSNESDFQGESPGHRRIQTYGSTHIRDIRTQYTYTRAINAFAQERVSDKRKGGARGINAAGCASRAAERVMCAHRKVSSLALAVAGFRPE